MSTSLSDILTAVKNAVTGINTVAQNYINVQGASSLSAISTTTLVKNTGGRVAVVSITTAGSATGSIYDSNSISSLNNKIYVIPNTVGVVTVNLPTNYGIVVAPGTGQVLTISYS
jgi:hypothetical protein